MKSRATKRAVALAMLAMSSTVHSEDIDLFIGTPNSNNGLPNVLFVIDNTANWNTAFTNEMSALAGVFDNLPTNDGAPAFNIGIMMANETGNPNNNEKGGYVRAAIRPMTDGNGDKYRDLIKSFDELADKGNGGYAATTMAEAYYYFSSGTPFAGNFKAKTDYTGNTSGTAQSKAVYALAGNALSSVSATKYNGPTVTGCTKNYIIFISNGPNQENNSSATRANNFLSAAGGSTTEIPLSPTGSQSSPVDEWARFMRKSPLGVVTYTIDIDPVETGQGPGWSALLKSASDVSDGEYAKVTSGEGGAKIAKAINRALSEIQAVNSVFASVSLPLSVNTQGTYLNQVYVGLFRPDGKALPRWAGNLKQFKLGRNSSKDLRLQDADGESAINSQTGFITECARSYWTPTAIDSYWAFDPQGACIPTEGDATTADQYKKSNSPDGNIVEKGAQGYVLRSAAPSSRNVKTCATKFEECDELTDFTSANGDITAAALGTTDADRTTLINWARGQDIYNENSATPNASTTDTRPSVHGDVVHSRPVALDFGNSAAPKVVVFYGGNDGMFRAVNGNRITSIGTIPAGGEIWSFVPPEFFGRIKDLRNNDTQIGFPTIEADTTISKPYGIDGAISAYRDSTRAWIFAAMRRGGRALYAFNVNTDNPSDISLKWKVGCPSNFPKSGAVSDTDCTKDFEGIGQTWSSPKAFTASGYEKPMLIMGGGYDTCEDAEPNSCASGTKGNKVYVMDADAGTLLTTFTTDRGVAADVTLVTDAVTGAALYGYVADLGGNLYRITMGSAEPGDWTMAKIASLGCSSAGACTGEHRKFIFAPDVINDAGTYVLLIGSGDREKPRNSDNDVDNYFFMVRDKPSDAAWLTAENANCDASVICLDSLYPITSSSTPSAADLATKGKGWYLGLNSNEQVVTAAITIFGTVTFSTNEPQEPEAGVCSSNLGLARVYNVNYKNASSPTGDPDRSEELPDNIGLPPSPVGGLVVLDDGNTVPFCIGCTSDSPLESTEPDAPTTTVPKQPKSRVYWYIER
jgi:type IV pilus assembly protein PilY1